MHRELCVLRGVIQHLLPRVGQHVKTLDLSHGKAVTNEIVSPSLSKLNIPLNVQLYKYIGGGGGFSLSLFSSFFNYGY